MRARHSARQRGFLAAAWAAAVSLGLGGCVAPPVEPARPGAGNADAGAPSHTAHTPPLRPLAAQPALPPGAPPRSDVPSVRYDLLFSGREERDDGVPGDGPPAEIIERGGASWYGIQFHQRRTANGERFDMTALTAAHRTLPFNTRVCVRSLVNGREVPVRINDRGPYAAGRIIDLSQAAADAIGMVGTGIKQVALSVMDTQSRRCGDKVVDPFDDAASPPETTLRRVSATGGRRQVPQTKTDPASDAVPSRLRR